MACGLGLKSENIELFRERVNSFAAAKELPIPKLRIDCKLNPAALSVEIVKQLRLMEPFGAGNPSPLFMLSELRITSISPVKNNAHLRITFSKVDATVTAMRFRERAESFPYKVGDTVDIAVSLDTNEFRGVESLSVYIRDIRFSGADNAGYIKSQRLFEDFCSGASLSKEEIDSLIPTREDFAMVYRYLRQLKNRGYVHPEVILRDLRGAVSLGRLRVILEAMNDLGLIAIYEDMKRLSVKMNEVRTKVDLGNALIIKRLKEVYPNGQI